MNQFQENSLSRYNVMRNTLNENSVVWNANATVSQVVDDFLNQLDVINNFVLLQLQSTKGITRAKLEARMDVIEKTLTLAMAAKAYAANTNDLVLQNTCNLTHTKLLQARGPDLIALAQNIYNVVSPFIINLSSYGADVSSLANQQNAINTFASLVAAPHVQKSEKIAATKLLVKAFADIREVKNDKLTPLMTQYKVAYPEFYTAYLLSCAIDNLGHRHKVSFKGTVLDANNKPIKNATITLSGPKKRKKITKKDGLYKFTQLIPGTYTFIIKLADGTEQKKVMEVQLPQVIGLDFVF
jgi:hypothetical protein